MIKDEWYLKKQIVNKNLLGLGINIFKEMYGSLSDESENPLSRVSVANSSFSLDPTRGCPLNCAYCVTLSNNRDLNTKAIKNVEKTKKYSDLFSKEIELLFNGNDLLDSLIKFDGFIPNKSVISISTGSSDPFLKKNQIEIEKIFNHLIKLNLKNPIWIVTKYGIPENDISFMKNIFNNIIKNGNKVILSVSYSGLPKEIEPYRGNRFSGMKELREVGVHISHHLRPIIKGINDTEEKLNFILDKSTGIIDSICIGGIRLDPSIILTWKYINGLDINILPNKPGIKDMPENINILLKSILENRGLNIQIFERSSQVISSVTGNNDYNLYKYRSKKNNLSYLFTLTDSDKGKLNNYNNFKNSINKIAENIGIINLDIYDDGEGDYHTNLKLNYQGNRLLIHAIGHSNILNN